MQQDALTKLSYGVYIIGTKDVDQNRFCGMASDAIMQVSIEPPMLAVSFMNNGYTKRQIEKTGRFSVSVLGENVDPAVIECFGYNSSKNIDKWSKVSCQVRSDLPYYGDSVSDLELKVVGEHRFENYTVFFANVVDSWDKKDEKPLTYVDYQTRLKNDVLKIFQNKRGVNKMENKEVWVCVVCGYVYDGDVPFEELPDTWTCPLCGVGKDMFEKRTV